MGKARNNRRSPALTASSADPLRLYELSVQDPVEDVEFLTHLFKEHRGRTPLTLREDFCGTAALCAAWAASMPERTAVGIDLDETTLDWARRMNLEPIGQARDRVTLHRGDVLDGWIRESEVVVAFNFSYCVLKKRRDLLRYFKTVRSGLAPTGFFVIDLHGGPDAQCEGEEEVEKDGFTYVWDQGPMDALTAHSIRRIHFRFSDGSAIEDAFSYDWRIWTLPELLELLREAGFARVEVYWEEADEDGNHTGMFSAVRRAENEEAFIAYLVSWRER